MPQNQSSRADLQVIPLGSKDRVAIAPVDPALLMTVESTSAEALVKAQRFALDRSVFLWLPGGQRSTLRTSATASRALLVAFPRQVLARVIASYGDLGIDWAALDTSVQRLALLPRTVWIHELAHRYLFERSTCGKDDSDAARFLETELVKEVFFLFRDHDAGADRASLVRWHNPCVQRAMAHIEANLFKSSDVAELAAASGASESTLLRAFHRELGCSPAAYWRSRRLDEALVLLRSGRSVGEVSDRVGYDNATAFSFAFRARFGRPPSAFVPRGRTRRGP